MDVKYVPWYPSSSASERPELGSSAPGEVAGAEDRMLDPVVYPGRSGRWYIYCVSASSGALQSSDGSTHHVHGLVIYTRPDIVLPLQEAREELHPEPLRETVRRDAPVPRLLPLLLAHTFPCALVLAHASVGLVAMELLLVCVRLRGWGLGLRGGWKDNELLGGLGRPLCLCCPSDGVCECDSGNGGPTG